MRFFHTILLLGAMLLCATANAEIDISSLPYSIQKCMNKYDHGLIHWHWKKMSDSEFCNKPKKKMQSFWGNYVLRCANRYCAKNRCEDSHEIDKRIGDWFENLCKPYLGDDI